MTAVLSEGRIGVHAGDEQARLKIDLVHKHGACLSRDTSAQCDDLNHWIVIFGSAQVDLLNSDGLNARFRAAQEDLHPRLDIAIGDNEALVVLAIDKSASWRAVSQLLDRLAAARLSRLEYEVSALDEAGRPCRFGLSLQRSRPVKKQFDPIQVSIVRAGDGTQIVLDGPGIASRTGEAAMNEIGRLMKLAESAGDAPFVFVSPGCDMPWRMVVAARDALASHGIECLEWGRTCR